MFPMWRKQHRKIKESIVRIKYLVCFVGKTTSGDDVVGRTFFTQTTSDGALPNEKDFELWDKMIIENNGFSSVTVLSFQEISLG